MEALASWSLIWLSLWTTNGSATPARRLHPVHRHDVAACELFNLDHKFWWSPPAASCAR